MEGAGNACCEETWAVIWAREESCLGSKLKVGNAGEGPGGVGVDVEGFGLAVFLPAAARMDRMELKFVGSTGGEGICCSAEEWKAKEKKKQWMVVSIDSVSEAASIPPPLLSNNHFSLPGKLSPPLHNMLYHRIAYLHLAPPFHRPGSTTSTCLAMHCTESPPSSLILSRSEHSTAQVQTFLLWISQYC